jgi:hypothetical protein
MRRPKGHECCHIESAHTNDAQPFDIGIKLQLAAIIIIKGRFRLDPGRPHQGHHFLQDAAFRQGHHKAGLRASRWIEANLGHCSLHID